VVTGIYDAGYDDDAREHIEPGILPVTDQRRCLRVGNDGIYVCGHGVFSLAGGKIWVFILR
jgi:hypothetical protein